MIYIFGNIWASHLIVSITLKFFLLPGAKVQYTIMLVLEFLFLALYFIHKIKRMVTGKVEILLASAIRLAILAQLLVIGHSNIQAFLVGSYMQLLMRKEPVLLRIIACLAGLFSFIIQDTSSPGAIIGTIFCLLMLLNNCIKYYSKQKKLKLKEAEEPIQPEKHAGATLLKQSQTNPEQSHQEYPKVNFISQPSYHNFTPGKLGHQKHIFNSFPDGVVIVNRQKEVTCINRHLKHLMGAHNAKEAFRLVLGMTNAQDKIMDLERLNGMLEEKQFIQQLSQDVESEYQTFKGVFDESRQEEPSEYLNPFQQSQGGFQTVNQLLSHLIKNPSMKTLKMMCQHATKSCVKFFQVTFLPFENDLLLIIRDITSFNAISQLEKQVQEKSNLFRNLAHEFRTPLQSIKLMVESIEPRVGEEIIQQFIRPIMCQLDCFLNMVQDLLDIAIMNAGKFKLNIQEVDLHALIQDTCKIMSIPAAFKQNVLQIQLGGIPTNIHSDPVKIRQILINLLGNSMKFTSNGVITVSGKITNNKMTELTVSDTGLGIAIQHQTKLFNAFSKLEDPTNQNPQGIGLGLMISNALARKLSANPDSEGPGLTAVSEGEGKGSKFSFYIYDQSGTTYEQESIFKQQKTLFKPLLNQVRQVDSFRMSGLDFSSYNKCQCPEILLVDDDPFIIKTLWTKLEQQGYRVNVAYSGFESLKKVDTYPQGPCGCKNYKIILLDIGLPGISGIETCQRLLQHGFKGHILAHSGYTDEKSKQDCLAAGMSAYFSKPVNPADLYQWIDQNRGCV